MKASPEAKLVSAHLKLAKSLASFVEFGILLGEAEAEQILAASWTEEC